MVQYSVCYDDGTKNKSEFLTQIEHMTFCKLYKCSNHWGKNNKFVVLKKIAISLSVCVSSKTLGPQMSVVISPWPSQLLQIHA